MRIAYLPTSFEPDRREAANITLRLLAEQVVKSNDVHIFTGNIRNKKKIEDYKRIRIVRLAQIYGFKGSFFRAAYTHLFASVKSLKRYLRENKIDFDIFHGFSSSEFLALRTLLAARAGSNSKKVHTLKSKSSFRGCRLISNMVLKKLDAIVVQTNKRKIELVKRGISKDKIKVIHSCIDTNKFKPKNVKKGKEKIILYYGHFNKYKGVEYLLHSLKFLKTKCMLFMIPSDNNSKHNYDQLIAKLGIKNIEILDSEVDLVHYINLSDVVVLPYPYLVSTEENPSCLLESMACRKPVVTSDLPELREIVNGNEHVLMAEPKNPRAIAEKIDLVLNNSKLALRLARNAHMLSKRFSAERIAKQHIDLYRQLRV